MAPLPRVMAGIPDCGNLTCASWRAANRSSLLTFACRRSSRFFGGGRKNNQKMSVYLTFPTTIRGLCCVNILIINET